jgi:hypothetical protein
MLENDIQTVATILVADRSATGEYPGLPNPRPINVDDTPPARGPFLLVKTEGLGPSNETKTSVEEVCRKTDK